VTDSVRLSLVAGIRSFSVALLAVHLGLYLADRGMEGPAIGLVISAGLAGGAFATLGVTLLGGRVSARWVLVTLALLSAAGSLLAAFSSQPLVLAVLALLGMLNGMGRDRGAATALEQAILPSTTDDAGRTRAFALYNLWVDGGGALGALCAALPELLGLAAAQAHQAVVVVHGALALLIALLSLPLRAAVPPAPGPVSPETRRVVGGISALFLLDATGGGFLTGALVSWFFFERFEAGAATVGLLFAAAKGLNALSHLGAAALARRIGLVNTMVFTHLPSSLLLVTVAFAPTFPVAAVLFLLREGLVEMDVPTRQSYVMALVRPEERPFASGVTSLVRLAGWAVGPALAGLLSGWSLGAPLAAGAALKILYDLLLWRAFRGIRPPEER
jgi:MFS family permease